MLEYFIWIFPSLEMGFSYFIYFKLNKLYPVCKGC